MPADAEDLEVVKTALDDAMRDIRDISRGLSLPELESLSLPEVLNSVVDAHRKRYRKRRAADHLATMRRRSGSR